jgi:integrase
MQAHPSRLDTPLVYPAADGIHLDLRNWRRGEWYTALDCAGLPAVTPYSLRHTFASFSIAAGVSLFYLARLMGTSVDMIDSTYGYLLPDSEDYLRGLLDTFDLASSSNATAGLSDR